MPRMSVDSNDLKLFDLVQCAVFVLEVDSEGEPTYIAMNRFACDVAGFDPSQLIGKTAAEVYGDRRGDIAYRHHWEAASLGSAITYELSLMLGGTPRKIRTHLQPIKDAQSRVTHLIGTSTDVTAEHIADEFKTGAETLSNELEEFVSLAAHDLRTPMRHVSAISNQLREGFTDLGDGKLELIDMLESVASKAMTLITDLLSNATTLQAGESLSEFELTPICEDLLSMLDPASHCEAKIENCRIAGDQTATQIVLRNLIDNALKHGYSDTLRLSIRAEADENDRFAICIQDNGAGFKDPAKVFLDGGKLRSNSGFGLWGIRRLVKARGGSISVANVDDGAGAIIRFTMPGKLL